ncbi:MAG: alpha/beta hydrolase [Chloroflexi bacterium]|nr:alpha/beta hydrolase [Chloroflexota bacterium]
MQTHDVLARHAVRVSGNPRGQPILFAHGFGCDQSLWRFVAPAFEEHHRVVTFDYVGAGASDRTAYDTERYASLDGYVSDVLDICRALDLRDLVILGHSVSAMIAMLATIREPDRFSDLVLLTPSPRYLDDDGYRGGFSPVDIEGLLDLMDLNATGWASYLAPIVMGNPDQPALTSDLEATFCSIDPVMARQFARVTFLADNRSDLASVSVPSLIVQCTRDVVAPMEVGAYLHEHIPHSTLAILDASGHCPQVSHPATTTALIKEHLRARHGAPIHQ